VAIQLAVAVDHALARDSHVDDVAGDLDGVTEGAVDVVLAGGAALQCTLRARVASKVAMVSQTTWSFGEYAVGPSVWLPDRLSSRSGSHTCPGWAC
jgi:hypothetical protein